MKTVLGQKQDSMKQKLNLKDEIVPSEKNNFQNTSHQLLAN